MSKGQITGMRGVYLVAAELTKLGLVVSPTARSAQGVDLLATPEDHSRTFSIEVKTVSNNTFWQLGKGADRWHRDYIYVFVRLQSARGAETITYYPVPSKFVAKNKMLPDPNRPPDKQYRLGFTIWKTQLSQFENKWRAFGLGTGKPESIDSSWQTV